MKRLLVALCTCAFLVGLPLSACAAAESETEPEVVVRIDAETAYGLMTSDRVVVLDVRTQEEYAASHIVNARLLPLDTINEESATGVAPDKDALVLVYCRTGVRSAEASEKLVELGYTQVRDFGGIMSWPYDTIDAAVEEHGTIENDELPVGVKVVCGKTKALPEE